MIEVLACREMTDKEKKKLEIDKQIKQLEAEKEKLESCSDTHNSVEVTGIKIENAEELDEDTLTQTMMAAELISGILGKSDVDDSSDDIAELSKEEEEVVSKAISKENNENLVLTDEQLRDIKKATEKEYNSIKVANKPKNFILYLAFIIAAIWIFLSVFSTLSIQNKNNFDNFNDIEHITVPIDVKGGE